MSESCEMSRKVVSEMSELVDMSITVRYRRMYKSSMSGESVVGTHKREILMILTAEIVV